MFDKMKKVRELVESAEDDVLELELDLREVQSDLEGALKKIQRFLEKLVTSREGETKKVTKKKGGRKKKAESLTKVKMKKNVRSTTTRNGLPRRGEPCTQNGCTKPIKAKGLCAMHYDRDLKGQDMSAAPKRPGPKPKAKGFTTPSRLPPLPSRASSPTTPDRLSLDIEPY